MSHRILVVDDDPHIRDVICFALEREGLVPSVARDGIEGLTCCKNQAPDLIILDVGMPEMDGLEVCRQIRKTSDVPILFLSARDEEIDRILGLEIGGDDYVTKPFSPRELVARVKTVLKRLRPIRSNQQDEPKHLSHGRLTLNTSGHQADFAGVPLQLTAIEFAILKGFLSRPSFVFTREQIMNVAYATNVHVADRTIDSHIRNIRAKVAEAGSNNVIETVHGVGFRLGLCETTS